MCPYHGVGGLRGRDIAPDSRLVYVMLFFFLALSISQRPFVHFFWALQPPAEGGTGEAHAPGPADLVPSSASDTALCDSEQVI